MQEASHAFADDKLLRRKVQSMSECYVELLPAAAAAAAGGGTGGPQVCCSTAVSHQFQLSETFFTILVTVLVSR